MADSPDSRTPDQRRQRDWVPAEQWVDDSEPKLSKEELQEFAHSRGRICKARGCEVCAPLRDARRLKKAQRKADAQAKAHAQGQPCGRTNCELDVCVTARNAPAAPPVEPVANQPATDQPSTATHDDPAQARARQAKRHKVGLPCGSEECAQQRCIDGFANERTRRHRARRPCRSATCDNPVCVAGRSTR